MGVFAGYGRAMSPSMLAKLDPDTDMNSTLGVRGGRQIEEEHADAYNSALVSRLGSMWYKAKAKGGKATDVFVNIADPALKDPTWRQIWEVAIRLLPSLTRLRC